MSFILHATDNIIVVNLEVKLYLVVSKEFVSFKGYITKKSSLCK